MGFDNKYGMVETENGDIPDDEPVIVFRGRDAVLPQLLFSYYQLCSAVNSPRYHLELIRESRDQIMDWQKENPDRVHIPTSENAKEWMD